MRSEAKVRGITRARAFAGVRPEDVECFIERVPVCESTAAIDRWKALRDEGWDVEALTYDDGGQVTELVGLGCRYLSATRGAEASVA